MHHADDQATAQAEVPVLVRVSAGCMLVVVVGMSVDMQMVQAVLMPVKMEMRALPVNSEQHASAQYDDHRAHGELQNRGRVRRDRFPEEKQHAAYAQQGHRVTDSPDTAAQNQRLPRRFFRAQCRDCGKVIGLQRMLNSDDAAKKEQRVVFHCLPVLRISSPAHAAAARTVLLIIRCAYGEGCRSARFAVSATSGAGRPVLAQ